MHAVNLLAIRRRRDRIEDAGEVYMETYCSDGLMIICVYYGITKVLVYFIVIYLEFLLM